MVGNPLAFGDVIMRTIKATIISGLIMLGTITSGAAFAWHHHHGHVRFGVYIGAPAFWYSPPPYYYYPYYPPVVAVPASPPVYVERGSAGREDQSSDAYWYYCADSRTYYPYVRECPGGWQRVVPQPPPGS